LILVDANVCLYAHDSTSPRHEPARRWLVSALGGAEPVRFPWATVLAFIRLTTNPRVYERPLSVGEAAAAVDAWLSSPAGGTVEPTERHWPILKEILEDADATGPLVADAHVAALALEHGATLATTDRDFRRFPGLRLLDPTAG
jgi:toxin-antitoxin system PIN domain toxin